MVREMPFVRRLEHNERVQNTAGISGPGGTNSFPRGASRPVPLSEIESGDEARFHSGIGELDRVLGGGAVHGSFVLVGGEPGIGKSTLLLQMCQEMCRNAKVLYVSGEESLRQIKLRAARLQISSPELYILSENGYGADHPGN